MPPKQVVSNFDARWRKYLQRVAKRVDSTISKVGTTIVNITIEELKEEAPWTGGGLLKREKYPSALRKGHRPVTPTGFVRFRKQSGKTRTFVIKNSMWPIYGRRLENGDLVHNADLGGRPWDPGFVARSLQNAKARYDTEK